MKAKPAKKRSRRERPCESNLRSGPAPQRWTLRAAERDRQDRLAGKLRTTADGETLH
jgi:hypothetical protein